MQTFGVRCTCSCERSGTNLRHTRMFPARCICSRESLRCIVARHPPLKNLEPNTGYLIGYYQYDLNINTINDSRIAADRAELGRPPTWRARTMSLPPPWQSSQRSLSRRTASALPWTLRVSSGGAPAPLWASGRVLLPPHTPSKCQCFITPFVCVQGHKT